ncbi:hypothetical protein PHMEG_00015754 [Phytophthora megakarya]|uniref:Uncharacterized protein n=1 Tax=Phytophthora megakarya TaxID=4795 RepID=A0A225W313_9STRA|nr:hypothetical protein PHMEG_00015754 [Phytophthora megakarya]
MGLFSRATITDFVRKGDIDGVRRRLQLGDDVNERRGFHNTPLIEAARYNVVEIVELLIQHGADLELTNSNDLTALHAAIDERKSSTAILLARHGASANRLGLFGRTPLQCAIKKNLVDVAAELLANGADPMVESDSAKIAIEYARGPNHDEFEKLLTAYTSVEAAIEAKNAAAITVCLRKALTGLRTAKISGIEAAIQLQHAEAVTTILQMSLASDTLGEMVEKYKIVERGLMNTDEEWRENLRQLGEDFGRGVLALLMDTGDVALLRELVEGTAEENWIQNLRLSNSWTALHLAAALGSFKLVRYLLVECGCNPLLVTSDEKTAHELAMEIDWESKVSRMLLQFMKQRAFLNQTAKLLRTEVTVVGLRQLLGKMTNVYDLRIIFSLGFRALSPIEMNAVLTVAFNEVIREKLILDHNAGVFFKLGLQECKQQNCISDMEKLVWDLKAVKMNVKNSDWIREISQLLQEVEGKLAATERNAPLLYSRFNKLRQELTQCDECVIQQHTRHHNISLLSSALILCGGPAMKELFGTTFDVWNAAKLLAVLSAERVEDFLAEKTNKFVYKSGVESLTQWNLQPY